MNAEYKIKLAPISDDDATGQAKELLENTSAKMGFVPNMYRIMANSSGYLSTYMHGYTAFRESSGFTAQEQELVFLVISSANGCDYCTAAHSMIADKVAKFDADLLAAARAGGPLADAKLQALAEMTSRLFETRGLVNKEDAQEFLNAGYQEQHILEIILALSVKTLSNYANHLFHTDIDAAFKDYQV